MQKLDKVREELFNVMCDVNALTLTLEDKAPMITLTYKIEEQEQEPMTKRATYNKTAGKWNNVEFDMTGITGASNFNATASNDDSCTCDDSSTPGKVIVSKSA